MALTRSQQMSRIRGRDTSPEVALRLALWKAGARYRLHRRTANGRPDLTFVAARLVVFVDGCFWHGCPEHYVRPRSGGDFWSAKLRENVERDRRQTLAFEREGWRVLRIWEHRVVVDLERVVNEIMNALSSGKKSRGAGWRVIRVEELARHRMERWTLERLRGGGSRTVVKARKTTKPRKRVASKQP